MPLIANLMFCSLEGVNLTMAGLEEEDDAVVVEIEPPKPKRKTIATLKVCKYL